MSQPFIGEIRIYAFDYPPAGWAQCSGQLLPIGQYETLFNLIGTTYGGDGQETFALPNLGGRVPAHYSPFREGFTEVGAIGGAEEVTLTAGEIPAHVHAVVGRFGVRDRTSPAGAALVPGDMYGAPLQEPASFGVTAIGPGGGSAPHTNVQPYVVLNFCISLFGVYPNQG